MRPPGAGSPGLGVGKPGRCGAGTPAAGPANQCLPASRAAAPAADGPLLPETSGEPRPARTPTACEGCGPTATLRPNSPGDPGIARPGGSTRALLLLCPASPILVARPRVASSPGRATGGSNVDVVSLTPTPKTLPGQDQGRGGADTSPHPARPEYPDLGCQEVCVGKCRAGNRPNTFSACIRGWGD